ncbi:MAG: GH92 family glycosyl hydrolase, partial [Candidatus Cryptobacteroides sp.]
LSHTGYEGALANFNAEGRNTSFNEARKVARKMWQEKCDKFQIEGTEAEKRTFYTAVYHSFFSPNVISDVNGDYFANAKKLHSDIVQYSNFSTWDTYRATHPLYTIIEQTGTRDFVNSLASRRKEAGTDIPLWECMGYDNCCMIGRSPVAIMTEAILKDIPGINVEDSYISMYESLFASNKCSWWYGYNNSGMEGYINRGYVTGDVGCAVSKTTEYNYYDSAMAKLAEKLGKKEDAEYFYKRSLGHRELWNPEKRFLWPRYADGTWREMNLNDWEDLKVNYVSGNIWGYSSYTPHDMDYMIELLGGPESYVKWLDGIFNDNSVIGGEQHVDISGFIGKYGHGDEPSHQMPYLYAIAGAPEKTQEIVHRICNEMYDDTPEGLVNNDDLGQMSSWYIFSSLGFYPVDPASCTYVLGRPLFRKATINLENGKCFTIKTENFQPGSYLVDKAYINGSEIKDWKISHKDIMAGGELVFVMK